MTGTERVRKWDIEAIAQFFEATSLHFWLSTPPPSVSPLSPYLFSPCDPVLFERDAAEGAKKSPSHSGPRFKHFGLLFGEMHGSFANVTLGVTTSDAIVVTNTFQVSLFCRLFYFPTDSLQC